jgi:hypothetical protein
MAHQPTEDVPYNIDDFALEDESAMSMGDEDQTAETKLIQEIRNYCKKAIAQHNSFDVLQIPQNAKPDEKIAVFDEMFNHKGLVHHLRQIEEIINNKVREN